MAYGYYMITCLMTSRDHKRSRSCLIYIWMKISRKPLQRKSEKLGSNGPSIENGLMENRMVTWSTVSRDQERPSFAYMFWAHYLENGWRQRLGVNGARRPIENGIVTWVWSRARWHHGAVALIWIYFEGAKFFPSQGGG